MDQANSLMSADAFGDALASPSHWTVREIASGFSEMLKRLKFLVGGSRLTDEKFVEISAIFNNVSYLFLYLESNAIHVNYESLLPWRDRFYNDYRLNQRLLVALRQLSCEESDVEKARLAYIEFLISKQRGSGGCALVDLEEGLARAKTILHAINTDVTDFLRVLGVPIIGPRPEVALYAIANKTKNARTRRKLHSAWRKRRDRRLDDLIAAIDQMSRARWDDVNHLDYENVVQRTFERCSISLSQIESFLDAYLQRAVESQIALAELMGAAKAPNGATMDDFGRHLRVSYGEEPIPSLPLEACIGFAFDVARQVLGLDFERLEGAGDRITRVNVLRGDRVCGRIHFDLWVEEGQVKDANYTRGLRNRTAWGSIMQIPVAHVSCRFRRNEESQDLVNFQNAHSLFHEFGHALNHLFITSRLPNQSGLEYLPIERLEILSMWYEKWIYHKAFEAHLNRGGVDTRRLSVAREIKMLEYRRTHLDRAVISALDLLIHSRPELGVRDAFRKLNDRFAFDEFCDFGAILPGFTWPMMQANPGAYFAYLWGAGKSAELFAPYLELQLDKAPAPEHTWGMLAECFDFESPSAPPSVESAFSFYGG